MSTPSVFTVTAAITFRPLRVPKGCRKPRPVDELFTYEFTVPSVTSAQAPVVALIPNDRGHLGSPGSNTAELRAYNGGLYTVETVERHNCTSAAVTAGSEQFPDSITRSDWVDSSRLAIDGVAKEFAGTVIIDGCVWRKTTEPVYAISTMGMGSNHGGTFLDIEVRPTNASPDRVFSLTDRDGAVTAALALAERYGDTLSFDRIRAVPSATILDASAFKVPSVTARIAAVEAEARDIMASISRLAGTDFTVDTLTEVKELADKARSLLSSNSVDTVTSAPTTDKATK